MAQNGTSIASAGQAAERMVQELIRRPLLRMLLGATLISFSPVFVAVARVPAELSAFYRMFFGALVMVVWLLLRRRRVRVPGGALPLLVLAGIFFATDLTFWHHSILLIGPGLSTLLANMQVFILPLGGLLLFSESIHIRFVGGALLAMSGLWMQVGMEWASLGDNDQLGVIFGMLTALAYAAYMISLRKAQSALDAGSPFDYLLVISVITALILALQLEWRGYAFAIPDLQSWLALLAYGLLCQVVGWVLITSAMPHLKAMTIGLLLLLQPTLSWVWDLLFFGRQLSLLEGVGVLLTLAGIYFGVTDRNRKGG